MANFMVAPGVSGCLNSFSTIRSEGFLQDKGRAKKQGRRRRSPAPLSRDGVVFGLTDRPNSRRLRTLLALRHGVLHFLPLGEGLVPVTLDAAVVHENVFRAVFRGDEPVPLLAVEPLHGPCCHALAPLTASYHRPNPILYRPSIIKRIARTFNPLSMPA